MIRALIFVLCLLGCTQINNEEQTVSKSALVIGHYQSVHSSIIPDSTKKTPGGLIMIIPPPHDFESDSLKALLMQEFVRDTIGDCTAVYFSREDHIKKAVVKFPFSQSVTKYNNKDISYLYIDSILSNGCAYMRFNNSTIHIDAGDSIIVTDSLMKRPDTNSCWERIIITHKIVNYGISVLPDKRFIQFF